MTESVSSSHNGFGNAHRSLLPTWKETADIKVFDHMRNPTPPPLPQSMKLQRENGDFEAESILCTAVCET
jgi:hypothetical protein